jgi:hypothetical protein
VFFVYIDLKISTAQILPNIQFRLKTNNLVVDVLIFVFNLHSKCASFLLTYHCFPIDRKNGSDYWEHSCKTVMDPLTAALGGKATFEVWKHGAVNNKNDLV